MNTHETYVTLETAKLLKEAGFDWKCYGNITDGDTEPFISIFAETNSSLEDDEYSAPTLEVAQRWLRELKGVDVFAYRNEPKDKFESVVSFDEEWSSTGMCINKYEDALEAGIKKALEIILEKGE